MRLREKMEKHYENVKEQIRELSQSETSVPSAYKSEFSPEEKENILKDIYNSIHLFYRLVCEAKKKSSKG